MILACIGLNNTMTSFDRRIDLSAPVCSGDEQRAYEVALQLEAGTVWVNQCLDLSPCIPWPAAKHSGIGIAKGVEDLRSLTQMTVVNIRKVLGLAGQLKAPRKRGVG
ncbi:aldehyde dehydrogenase family protein [Burkholderia pseudomallei]|nr:aldehyde dehydrogenase family protein [Burkholderia pseudomallei]